jgi:hypothetical protein
MLDAAAAAAALSGAGRAARGFLGIDPVTQNGALIAAELTRMGAQVCRAGDTLVAYAHRASQPRQALVASTSAHAGPVAALLSYLRIHQRSTSYLALVPAGSAAIAAFEGCGFRPAGVLRDHRYQSGGYTDVLVYFAKGADTCRS